jgi:hypothetical protein
VERIARGDCLKDSAESDAVRGLFRKESSDVRDDGIKIWRFELDEIRGDALGDRGLLAFWKIGGSERDQEIGYLAFDFNSLSLFSWGWYFERIVFRFTVGMIRIFKITVDGAVKMGMKVTCIRELAGIIRRRNLFIAIVDDRRRIRRFSRKDEGSLEKKD